MGIPSCRFTDRTAEEFTCTVCLEVVEDPLVVTDCEHIFCRLCLENEEIAKCPTCQEAFKDPKWHEIKGFNKRLYNSMFIRCLNPSCEVVLNVDNYKEHDEVCPVTYDICKTCNFKTRRDVDKEYHSCSQTIKYDREMAAIKKEFERELSALKQEKDDEMESVNDEIADLKEMLHQERHRYERLIINCVTYRNKFSDDSTLDKDHVDSYSYRQGGTNSARNFKLIADLVDDYVKRNPNAEWREFLRFVYAKEEE